MSHIYKRRLIREKVLQILYAYEMNREGHAKIVSILLEDVDDTLDKEFASQKL